LPDALSHTPSGTLRNDFGDFVGFRFTVGAAPLYVTHLGRWKVAGNSGAHTVKLYDVGAAADIPGGSVSLNLSGGTDGAYNYAALPSRIALSAGGTYIIASQEALGGDQWYDAHVITWDFAVIDSTNSAYYLAGWNIGSGSVAYVPPNFQYSLTDPGPGGGGVVIPVFMHHYRQQGIA
jgi:hypothetical protein